MTGLAGGGGRAARFGPPPPGRRRLDPRTLVTRLATLSALRQYWGAIVPLAAVLGLRGGFRLAGIALLVAVAVAVSAAAALVEWWRTSYGVQDGRLVVERGLLRRALTVVPVDRIRGVDVHASALQRLLGIVSVRVDAAATGGRDDEAVLDSVDRAQAYALRDLLLREVPAEVGRPEPAGESLARLDPRWLLYAPLVGTYLLAPLAALAAFAQVADEVQLPLPVRRWLDDAAAARPGGWAVAAAVAGLLLLAAAGAVATAAVANWGFTLTRSGGTLVAERGLLSRRQVSLEHDRIRGYALAQPLALRLVRAARLTALVTGLGGSDDEGGTGRRGQLLPLGPAAEARRVAAAAVVRFDAPLRRHPPAARGWPGRCCRGCCRPPGSAGPGCGPGWRRRWRWRRSGCPSGWTGTPGSATRWTPGRCRSAQGRCVAARSCWPGAGWSAPPSARPGSSAGPGWPR